MLNLPFNLLLGGLLFAPVLALASTRWKRARSLPAWFLLPILAAGIAAALQVLMQGARMGIDLSWFAPLPFVLSVDRLSAYFLLLICAIAAPVVVFSGSYVERHYGTRKQAWFWVLLPLFLLSMVVVVAGSTIFAFLFGWELMTLFSAGLVTIEGWDGERRRNTFTYLVMMHAGAGAVVGAFLLFMPHAAGTDFAALRAGAPLLTAGGRAALFLLAFIGFGAKAGIVPLHIWLPKTHPIAPSPVSALMSAVMLKTAVYGFIRFTFDFLASGPPWWGYAVLTAGAVSALVGVLYAISERDLKRLLAYSSVENIGIIFMAIGAAMVFRAEQAPVWAALALAAALLHSLNHALFKSLLFLGAGSVADATHTQDIEKLGGLLSRMRATGIAVLVACSSIAGLPLLNGFVSEWLAFRSFLAGGELPGIAPAIVLPLMAGVLALVGGLAAACFAKVYGVAFLGRPRSDEAEHAREVSPSMRIGMGLLAAGCVLLGVAPAVALGPVNAVLQQLLPGAGVLQSAQNLERLLPWVAALVLALILAWLLIPRKRRETPTWACGLPGLDSRMQYTSTSFSKPLRKVFARFYRPDRTVEILPHDQPCFPAVISYRSIHTTAFEHSLYRPALDTVIGAAQRLRRMQTGNIQVYLLYLFLALLAALFYMRLS